MSNLSQGLLLETGGKAGESTEAERPRLVALPQVTHADAPSRRRKPPFQRRPGRQLKLVLLPHVAPEPQVAQEPLAPMALAEAFGGAAAGLSALRVTDDTFRDALLSPGDAVLLGPSDLEQALAAGALVALRVGGGPVCLRRLHACSDGHLRLSSVDTLLPDERVPAAAVAVEGRVISIVRAPREAD